jgi:SpoVK/Ycf46/Vps4 family AAA+-type ATPase
VAPKRELLRLFRSLAAVDWHEAKLAASSIAEWEATHGHHALAAQLRSTLSVQPPTATQGDLLPKVSENGSAPTLNALSALHAPVRLSEVAMPKRARDVFSGVIQEQQHQSELSANGLRARRRILIHGPPGCGKSMTARALATELGLPVFVVRLDAIVGAYLGQTASRVRELFRFVETVNCVLLLDEIDALGRSRGDTRDIGELDRVAISLMQELEHAEPKGLLVATSNLVTALDRALLRRFDLVQEFRQPSPDELLRFAKSEASRHKLNLDAATLRQVRASRSYANALRVVTDYQRDALLKRLGPMTTSTPKRSDGKAHPAREYEKEASSVRKLVTGDGAV